MLFNSFILILSLLTIPTEKTQGPMEPLTIEKLKTPISLKDKCEKISIVEWKSNDKNSLQSQSNIDLINNLCNKIVGKFYSYSGLKESKKISEEISFLPDNSNYRNLNDSDFRFFYRSKTYTNGIVDEIYGYHQRSNNHLYITNQILINEKETNKIFKQTFAHELYHALSWQNGVYAKRLGNKDQEEEKAAEKFALLFKQ